MVKPKKWEPFSLTHITYPIFQSPSFHRRYVPKILSLLSLTPPFGVCALTIATLIYKDVIAAYLLVGSLLSTAISAILKQLIRQPRPPRYDDDKLEYGMPSNHSCFAWFCTTFIILHVLRDRRLGALSLPNRASLISMIHNKNSRISGIYSVATRTLPIRIWHFLHTGFVIGTSLLVAAGCAYSRIYLGYHTTMQVYVGSIIGTLFGVIWYRLLETSEVVQRFLISLAEMIDELEQARWKELTNDDEIKKD